jgi:chromosome partitioning protein
MRKIAILNQKGGVGKTTTAVNLSAGLARQGARVCLIDLDPQAHATTHLGVEPQKGAASIYDVLVRDCPIETVKRSLQPNLTLIPSHIDLAAAEVELTGVVGREVILREALAQDSQEYDYLIMDCAPSLGVLTVNALVAAHEVFIPLQPHFFALHGLSKLLETTSLVARRMNPSLQVSGVVICLYDSATKLAQEVVNDLAEFLNQSRGQNVPWKEARIFETRIRRNVKLAECPSFGQSIFEYAPSSNGALDYFALAQEIHRQANVIEIGGEPEKGNLPEPELTNTDLPEPELTKVA